VTGRLLSLYREQVSAVDGDRCPMSPTCSEYALRAFDKHGPFMGWIMTCDRLLRCGGNEIDTAPPVVRGGRRHWHDPVEANDFWWAGQEK
jgi:putative membrane protein insertion efficiency factor